MCGRKKARQPRASASELGEPQSAYRAASWWSNFGGSQVEAIREA
jgi:hypothetical protein